jgi:hypothetical protein
MPRDAAVFPFRKQLAENRPISELSERHVPSIGRRWALDPGTDEAIAQDKGAPQLWKAARENKEPLISPWHGGCRDERKGALRDRKGAERNEHGHRRGYPSWCRAQKLCLESNMYPPRVPRPHRDYDPQCATRRRSQCPEMVLGLAEWGEKRWMSIQVEAVEVLPFGGFHFEAGPRLSSAHWRFPVRASHI